MIEMDYLTSVSCGLFIASLILLISRFMSMPITGIILAIVLSAFIAAFIYNPSTKKDPKHRSLRGTSASVFFCLIFSIILTVYYIPRLSNVFTTADMSTGVALIIILVITVVGGIVIGTIGGSIGSTFRDLYSVAVNEKKSK